MDKEILILNNCLRKLVCPRDVYYYPKGMHRGTLTQWHNESICEVRGL